MSDNNGAPTVKLTPKQQHFADLLIAGVDDSDAYRKACDTENMAPATIQREAHALNNHPKITTALAAARAVTSHETRVDARDLVAKLQEIADAPVQEPVRVSDKIAANDKIAKIAGFYRDGSKEHRVVDGAVRIVDPEKEVEGQGNPIRDSYEFC